MVEKTKPKAITIISLLIGTIVILLLTIGCVLDWQKKIQLNIDYTINVLYHPISGVISIIFFTLLVAFMLEYKSPGKLETIKNNLEEKKMILIIIIIIVSLILLVINSIMLLNYTIAGTPGIEIFIALHNILGVIFGVFLTISLIKPLISQYVNDPETCQKYLVLIVIITTILLTVMVIVGIFVGLIIL